MEQINSSIIQSATSKSKDQPLESIRTKQKQDVPFPRRPVTRSQTISTSFTPSFPNRSTPFIKSPPLRAPSTKPPPQRSNRSQPKISRTPRPLPSSTYLTAITTPISPPCLLPAPRKILTVIDLNGVLIHRPKTSKSRRSTRFLARPYMSEFLTYIFSHHRVFFWTSARKANVDSILAEILAPEQVSTLKGVWTREDLGLDDRAFEMNVQVYKPLSKLWESLNGNSMKETEGKEREKEMEGWDRTNTVLLDDCFLKASSEPWNHISIREFKGQKEKDGTLVKDGELERVQILLERLKWSEDVSRSLYWDSQKDTVIEKKEDEETASVEDAMSAMKIIE